MSALLIWSNLRAIFGARGLRREGGAFVAEHVIDGKRIAFAIRNPSDAIQRHHMVGLFYERSELDLIARHCRPGSVFVDIGANVGNHALFVATHLAPRRIYVFEPNPEAIVTLRDNIALNGLDEICETRHLGVGLSDEAGGGKGVDFVPINLGAARIVDGGTIELRTGDELLEGVEPDFLKIDVEGMELQVLRGLENTINRSRPVIFVEVHQENWSAFDRWVQEAGYRIDTLRDCQGYRNILLLPT